MRARGREELHWAANYASMLRASIIGYLVTGAFLSFAYFDLAYLLFVVSILLKVLVDQQLAPQPQAPTTSTPRRAPFAAKAKRPPLRRPMRTERGWPEQRTRRRRANRQ